MEQLYMTGKALNNFQRMKNAKLVKKKFEQEKKVAKRNLTPTESEKLNEFVKEFKTGMQAHINSTKKRNESR